MQDFRFMKCPRYPIGLNLALLQTNVFVSEICLRKIPSAEPNFDIFGYDRDH